MHPLACKDTFKLSHGGHTVRLRASLQAAMRLERLHDGFPNLFRKVAEFDTQTIKTIIATAATDQNAADTFLESLDGAPLHPVQRNAQGLVVSLCAAFFPPEPTPKDASTTPGKPMPWSDAYAELYRIGTGWLSWTPAETWAATPTEIVQALEGKIAHLTAMNGGSDAKPSDTTDEQRQANITAGLDPDFDRAGLNALKARL
jgi:Phage tail assembly chaperone protein, TAC